MSQQNIAFANSPTVGLTVALTSVNVALPQESPFLLVSNIGANPAFVCTGLTAPTAVATTGNNICIPAGQTFLLRVNPNDAFLSAISLLTGTQLSISNVNGGIVG